MEDLGANDSLINKLPDECLQHIFSFLDFLERLEVERVCKRWRIIGERGWSDIKGLEIERHDSYKTVHSILKRCGRFLRHLKIYISSKLPHFLSMIMEFCKLDQLEDIDIEFSRRRRNVKNYIHDLRELFERSRKLADVTIRGYGTVYPIDCLNILNPETLRILELYNLDHSLQENDRLSINPDHFPHLRELSLQYIKIIGEEIQRERGSLNELEKLMLRRCDVPENFMQRILTFSNLQELTLNQNDPNVSDQHIRDIARYCIKIKKMCIIDCPNLTNDCFKYFGEMPSLEILELDTFRDVSSRDFMYLTNVRHLIFHFEEDVHSGHAVIELIINSSNLKILKLLFGNNGDTALVNDLRRIFDCGQRQKPLHLTIVDAKVEYPHDTREVSDHPLLTVNYRDD